MWTGLVALLSPRMWFIALAAVVLIVSHTYVYKAGKESVQNKWDVSKAKATEAAAKAEADSRAKERDLQTKADEKLKAKNDEIAAIDARLRSTLASLRIARKPRPAPDVSAPARACDGATGAELSGSDSEFLVRESARADRLRAALDQCYTQYNAARETLKGK